MDDVGHLGIKDFSCLGIDAVVEVDAGEAISEMECKAADVVLPAVPLTVPL